jgi:hypothetical protein
MKPHNDLRCGAFLCSGMQMAICTGISTKSACTCFLLAFRGSFTQQAWSPGRRVVARSKVSVSVDPNDQARVGARDYGGYSGRKHFKTTDSNFSIDDQSALSAKFAGIWKQFCDSL